MRSGASLLDGSAEYGVKAILARSSLMCKVLNHPGLLDVLNFSQCG